jgi:hypothetical protein
MKQDIGLLFEVLVAMMESYDKELLTNVNVSTECKN